MRRIAIGFTIGAIVGLLSGFVGISLAAYTGGGYAEWLLALDAMSRVHHNPITMGCLWVIVMVTGFAGAAVADEMK